MKLSGNVGVKYVERGVAWPGLHTMDLRLGNWKQSSKTIVDFSFTPWKFNTGPENGWLEDEFPFGIPYFQGLC